MKAWLIAVSLMISGTLAGCGGGSNVNSIHLTQVQARQLGTTVSDDVSKALASVVGNPAVPLGITARENMLVALKRNSSQADAVSPEGVTCSGSSCTVSGTFNCPDGGSIMVSGTFSANGTSASGTITATPSSCSDGTLVISGNPDVTATVQANDNGVTTTVNLMIGGGVSFSPVRAGQFPTGSCSLNVTASFSVNNSSGSVTSSSISGSICGNTIN
ncbi:MAG TPA: hypothetical protein VJN92_09945 [Candidatus Acidoferrum sp.]|nr:hypothetical protein [Candidatus Acidoferrum sp.]